MIVDLSGSEWTSAVKYLLQLLEEEGKGDLWVDIRDYLIENGIKVYCTEACSGIFHIDEDNLILFKLKYS